MDRRAEMLGRGPARHIAHQLQPEHAGGVVAPRLDLRGRGQDRDAAAGARRLVPRGRQAVEVGMHLREEAAEQALTREQVGHEIADMAALDVARLDAGRGHPLAQRFRERARDVGAFPRPVAREIALPAAQHVHHPRILLPHRVGSIIQVGNRHRGGYARARPRKVYSECPP